MRAAITKKQPSNAKHFVQRRPAVYAIGNRIGIGSSASGGEKLPEGTDAVTISMTADDGEDSSSSTRIVVTFGLDDSPDIIDSLIGRLTDLRTHQQRIKRGA